MNVYYYDKFTNEYLAFAECEANPEESKIQQKFVPLVPAFATLEIPPICGEDEIPVFDGNHWVVKKDYRKNYLQVDEALHIFEITKIGNLDDGYYLVEKSMAQEILEHPQYFKLEENIVVKKSVEEIAVEDLARAKNKKLQENEEKRQVEFVDTEIGRLKTETPLGDLKTALPLYDKIVQAKGGLSGNMIRLYKDGNIVGNPELTLEEYNELSVKVALEYIKIDALSTKITQQILSAQSIEEVQQVKIDYSNLGE